MLFSIVITAFNSSDTIKKCLDSILCSTSKDFEILLVDDCSVKTVKDEVAFYNDPRCNYIYNEENIGCGLSRNVGLSRASGKYITFIDADDSYSFGAVDIILENLKNNNKVDLLVFDYSIMYEDKRIEKYWKPSEDGVFYDFMSDKLISTTWNKVYCKKIIDSKRIRFIKSQSQDSVFNLQFLLASKKNLKIDKNLYLFDKTGESVTKSKYSIKKYLEIKETMSFFEKVYFKNIPHVSDYYLDLILLRKYLFLYKSPFLRFYRDWSSKKLDSLSLKYFQDYNELGSREITSLYKKNLIGLKDFLSFSIANLVSPKIVFFFLRLMKIK
ncbi:glycosyltransferase [Pistricoccus aurantiacus]|uniref:Glycosyltransferase n=1 Tax=Pistricoccus aurantiacus TaxID=1883414 RepID=A0A5B8SZ30_9GAMM|nr:glycosyltransferase family 2 protein [Pistricoccus aurantiacus]QEA40058.1 glycosyltransferase [Pistricoccus aurantiacus]